MPWVSASSSVGMIAVRRFLVDIRRGPRPIRVVVVAEVEDLRELTLDGAHPVPGMVRLVMVVTHDQCALVPGLYFFRSVVLEVLKEVEALTQVARRPLDPELSVDQEDVPYGQLPERVSDTDRPCHRMT